MKLLEFINENYYKNEFIARMTIPENRNNGKVHTYHYNTLSICEQNNSADNVYMSMNPLKFKDKRIARDKQHVAALRWLYVDLDTYKSKYKELTNEQILFILEQDYFGSKIPYPTYVINSGRGMYCLWKINEHIKATPRWERVQRFLTNTLLDFGADTTVVTDTSRVLRMIGSTNTKSGSIVNVMSSYKKSYTLYEIMNEYAPELLYDNSKKNNTQLKKKTYKVNKTKKSTVIYYNTPFSLYTARIRDLEVLLKKHRDKVDSKRECILFLYRYYLLCVLDDKKSALQGTLELNNSLDNPLSENEVIYSTASAEKYYDNNKCLILKNTSIIKFLSIIDDEMADLKTIISKDASIQRKKIRNKKHYLNKLYAAGKEEKKNSIYKRRLQVKRLIEDGRSITEICQKLNISKRTFYNDKKALSFDVQSHEYNSVIEQLDQVVGVEESQEKVRPENDSNNVIFSFKGSAKNSALVLLGVRSTTYIKSGKEIANMDFYTHFPDEEDFANSS